MNIVSNLIFHCNKCEICDANRAFITIRESTAAAPSNTTSSFIVVETERSTSQQSVTIK